VTSANPNSGVIITVSPNDTNGLGNGTTLFARNYPSNQVVTLTAPANVLNKNFLKWQRDGVDFTNNLTALVTMDTDHMMTAVYGAVSPCVLTVASVNPNSGVNISVSPSDTNGLGNGTTLFTRVFTNNAVVTLIAPLTAGGNNFQKWQRDGSDLTTTATATVTMGSDHVMTAVYSTPVPVGECVGHWMLDDGSGLIAMDSSGYGNHGQLTNGPIWTPGQFGGALGFDGVNDYVVVPDADLLEFAGRNFTVALWVLTAKSGPQSLVEKQQTGSSGVFLLALNRDNVAPGRLSVWTGSDWIDGNFNGLTDGHWHHVAVTWDGTAFRLYRDGQLDKTQTANATYQASSYPLHFGRCVTAGINWYYQGCLDDIRRCNRALSSAEIAALAGAAPQPTSTVRSLTVTSSNPNSGVAITVSPVDTNGLGNGTTFFTRYYTNNSVVTLSAPSTAGGNVFLKWQRNGADFTNQLTAIVTMDADQMLTAVYAVNNATNVADLVGWWKLDDGGGTTALDSSGLGYHGRLTNGPVFTNMARINGGLIFDGVNDHVVVSDTDILDFNGRTFTVALWVKTTKSGPQALVEKQHQFFSGLFLFALNRDGAVPGGFSVWTGGFWIDSNFRGVADGQFHHLAVTYDGTTFRLYRDGQLDTTQASSANYANTSLPLNFGRFATANVGWSYQGVMDDLRRYNRALSSSEISTLASLPSMPAPALASSGLAPRLTGIQIQSSGTVRLQGIGLPNHAYYLEASDNLIDWTELSAVEADDAGVFELSDLAAAPFPSRFYRVRVP
jgi:hypothetical protein